MHAGASVEQVQERHGVGATETATKTVSAARRASRGGEGRRSTASRRVNPPTRPPPHPNLAVLEVLFFQTGTVRLSVSIAYLQASNASLAVRGRHRDQDARLTDLKPPDPVEHRHALAEGQRARIAAPISRIFAAAIARGLVSRNFTGRPAVSFRTTPEKITMPPGAGMVPLRGDRVGRERARRRREKTSSDAPAAHGGTGRARHRDELVVGWT